jgi:hypothetical protein
MGWLHLESQCFDSGTLALLLLLPSIYFERL